MLKMNLQVFAYAGKKALIKVSGAAVAMADEPTTTGDNQAYQITNAAKRIIALGAAITVEDGGAATAESYTVNRLNGTITFSTVDATRVITVTSQYVPLSVAAECHEYTLTINGEPKDVTAFQANWLSKIQGLKSAEGSLSRWWDIDTYFVDALTAGNPIVLELYAQSDLEPDRLWAILNSSEMSAAVDGVVEDSVSFESTDKLLAATLS